MRNMSRTELFEQLIDFIEQKYGKEAAELAGLDPFPWVLKAFPWGEGELAKFDGA